MAWNDLLTIALAVLTILNFAFGRKDKSDKDVGDNSYKQGMLDQQLKNIMEKLDKIEKKLEFYDNEIDARIEKALEIHEKEYHKAKGSK